MEQEQKETTKDTSTAAVKPLPLAPEELQEIQSELRIE